jgi:hypothetical protein
MEVRKKTTVERSFPMTRTEWLSQLERRLKLSPRRVVLKTLDAINQIPPRATPFPVFDWIKKMKAEILAEEPAAARACEDAERTVFFLLGLYASALTSWIEETFAALNFANFAMSYSDFGRIECPEINDRLLEHFNRVEISQLVLERAEECYLGAAGVPWHLRIPLLLLGRELLGFCAIVTLCRKTGLKREEYEQQADAELKALVRQMEDRPSSFEDRTQLQRLLEVLRSLSNRHEEWCFSLKLLIARLESKREEVKAKAGNQATTANPRQNHKKGKRGKRKPRNPN